MGQRRILVTGILALVAVGGGIGLVRASSAMDLVQAPLATDGCGPVVQSIVESQEFTPAYTRLHLPDSQLAESLVNADSFTSMLRSSAPSGWRASLG